MCILHRLRRLNKTLISDLRSLGTDPPKNRKEPAKSHFAPTAERELESADRPSFILQSSCDFKRSIATPSKKLPLIPWSKFAF